MKLNQKQLKDIIREVLAESLEEAQVKDMGALSGGQMLQNLMGQSAAKNFVGAFKLALGKASPALGAQAVASFVTNTLGLGEDHLTHLRQALVSATKQQGEAPAQDDAAVPEKSLAKGVPVPKAPFQENRKRKLKVKRK